MALVEWAWLSLNYRVIAVNHIPRSGNLSKLA
jgi:hypothetical protein